MTIIETSKMFDEFLKEHKIDISKKNAMQKDSIYSDFLVEKMGFDPISEEQQQAAFDNLQLENL